MIGGKVIEVRPMTLTDADNSAYRREVVRLWCIDHSDECAVYTEPATELPRPGDDVWWQSGKIYWTPLDRRFVDRPIPKVGYSVPAPSAEKEAGS